MLRRSGPELILKTVCRYLFTRSLNFVAKFAKHQTENNMFHGSYVYRFKMI